VTSTQFRSSSVRVAAFRELLKDPTLAEAIVCLRDEQPIADAADGADPVVSVRLLSRIFQHNLTIETLLSLGEPLPVQQPDETATFGIDLSRFEKPPAP
jgi:hypothetical protein